MVRVSLPPLSLRTSPQTGAAIRSSPACHCEEGKARRGNPSFLGRFRAVSVGTVSDGPFLSIAKERGKERQQKLRFCISFRAMSSPLRYLIPRVRGEFPDYVSPSNAFITSAAAADAIDDRNKFVLLISTDCHNQSADWSRNDRGGKYKFRRHVVMPPYEGFPGTLRRAG